MAILSAFEVLYETLVPTQIVPLGPNNPLLVQGFWVQVSLAPNSQYQSTSFNIVFQETTLFNQGLGRKALQAQYIDSDGNVNLYPNFFDSTANGFLNQFISAGETLIYGVQCIPGLTLEAIPQGGTGWRGTVQINPQNQGALVATPTQRLAYYSGSSINSAVVCATVYGVPTFDGNTSI